MLAGRGGRDVVIGLAGVDTFDNLKSSDCRTVVIWELELLTVLGSEVVEDIVAVLLRLELLAVVGATLTTKVKFAEPTAKEGLVQLTVPLLPMAGVVQVQPGGVVID